MFSQTNKFTSGIMVIYHFQKLITDFLGGHIIVSYNHRQIS